MSIVRGRVYVPELYQGTMCFGSPTTLRFRNGEVIDTVTGQLVPTVPFVERPAEMPSKGLFARLVSFFWMEA